MNPGLLYLLRKESVGALRMLRRRLRGAKGVIAIFGFGLFLLAVLGPRIAQHLSQPKDPSATLEAAENFRLWGPPAMLLAIVTFGLSSKALYFKPAEVDFLFPAPISRRQLVAFNVLARLRMQVVSALWCSVFFYFRAGSWLSAFLGSFLLFGFMQLTAQTSGLLFSALSESLGKRIRRVAWLALGLAVIAAIVWVRANAPEVRGTVGVAREIVDHPFVRSVSWVTRPFVEVFLSSRISDLARWGAISVGILLIEVGVILLSDVAFSERALSAAQKVQARLRRLRSEGSALAAASAGSARWSLPAFPLLAGAGVLAWRQALEMVRHFKSILLMFAIGLLPVLPLVLFESRSGDVMTEGGEVVNTSPIRSAYSGASALILMTILFTQNAAFDFRRDLDRMVTFKALPLGSSIIAAGQVLPMALLLVFVQMVSLLVLAVATGAFPASHLLLLCLVLLPLDWLVVCIDNAVFLTFPYRITPQDAGNVPFMGRMMITMFLKMLLVFVSVGVAVAGAFLVWSVAGESLIAAGIAATAILVALAVPSTFVVAFAFDRFDVSRDV